MNWDEITLYWGPYHDHVLWASGEQPLEAAENLIDSVERIMSGEIVRIVAYDENGAWQGSHVLAHSEATLDYAHRWLSKEAKRVSVVSWPKGVVADDPPQ